MSKWYVRLKTGAVLSENEYDNAPHHNPATDGYGFLGDYPSREDARKAAPVFLEQVKAMQEAQVFLQFAVQNGVDPDIIPTLALKHDQLSGPAQALLSNPGFVQKYAPELKLTKEQPTLGAWMDLNEQDVDIQLEDKDSGEHYLPAVCFLSEEDKSIHGYSYSPQDTWLRSLPLAELKYVNGSPTALVRTAFTSDQTNFLLCDPQDNFDSLTVCNEYDRAHYAEADFSARLAYLQQGTPFETRFDGNCMDVLDPRERKELCDFLVANADVFVYKPHIKDENTFIAYALNWDENDRVFFEDCTATVHLTEPGKGLTSTIDGKLCYAKHKAKQAKEGIQLSSKADNHQRD